MKDILHYKRITYLIAHSDELSSISKMQLYNIAVLKDTASFYHQAPAEVKAAADYITLDVDRGGIAAIKKFLL